MIYSGLCLIWCLLARIRTWDPLIKSQLLYQLSYEEDWECKSSDFLGNITGIAKNFIFVETRQ